jgi:hypothetical protein
MNSGKRFPSCSKFIKADEEEGDRENLDCCIGSSETVCNQKFLNSDKDFRSVRLKWEVEAVRNTALYYTELLFI